MFLIKQSIPQHLKMNSPLLVTHRSMEVHAGLWVYLPSGTGGMQRDLKA